MKSAQQPLVPRSSSKDSRSSTKESTTPDARAASLEEEGISIFPWSAVVCCVLAAVCVLATVAGLALSSWERAPQEALSNASHLSWHARCAMLLIIHSIVMEVCIMISSYTAVGIAGDDLKPKSKDALKSTNSKEQLSKRTNLAEHNFGDSCIILMEYLLKVFTAYHFMYPEGTVAYRVPLSLDPERMVFPVRHIQFALGVPLLVLLSNRAFLAGHCSQVQVLLRSLPGLFLTTMYCTCAYTMEVTTSTAMRNLLMVLVLLAFVVSSADQILLGLSTPNATARNLKLAMLGYQVVTFAFYAVVYFSAYLGYVSSPTEQSVYTYMDATVKVLQGCFLSMIRNYEDIRIIKLWWTDSAAARRDFENLVTQARVPIFAVDLEGRVTSWNESLAQITGLPGESVVGVALSALLKKDCVHGFRQAERRASAAVPPSSNSLEIFFRRDPFCDEDREPAPEGGPHSGKQGCSAVLFISVVKKLSRDGAVEGYVGIGQDITEMCEMKAVEQKKNQLMAVVSHELRSPLHGIIGLTNMMEQTASDKKSKSQLGMVRCCANRLLDLVTNIMEMTESEQRQRKGLGAQDKKSLVNFLDVAEEVTVMTMMATDKAGKPLVAPEVHLANLLPELENFPVVLGNQYKCTQLLYNLVTNACKFTKQGHVRLRAVHRKDTSTLELHVEDTGSGIAPEALDRIFKPFEQDHGSTADARSFQGMGLGLAVCKEAARLHNGSIKVSSRLNHGTTFTVTLPCEDYFVERSSRSADVSTALASDRARALGKVKKVEEDTPEEEMEEANARPLVLSVDDDAVNQEVVRSALSEKCDIQVAMDGKQALDYLQSCISEKWSLPDVILLDIQMPGLTGYDVLAEIRKEYSCAHSKLPIIMVSAKAPSGLAAIKSYHDGCSDFVVKPFDVEILKAKVNVALEVKKEIKDCCKAKSIFGEAARIAQDTAKGATERAERQAKDAKDAKDAQASLDWTRQRLQEAEQKARKAEQQAAQAEERADGLSERAAGMEQELARLRRKLEESCCAARPAAPPAGSTIASTTTGSRRTSESCGGFPEVTTAETTPRSPPAAWPRPPPQPAAPAPAPFGASALARGEIVPWLYEELADREQQIAKLSGRLAAVSNQKDHASQQLAAVLQAAWYTRSLLQEPAER